MTWTAVEWEQECSFLLPHPLPFTPMSATKNPLYTVSPPDATRQCSTLSLLEIKHNKAEPPVRQQHTHL